jgi:hypothetical protein
MVPTDSMDEEVIGNPPDYRSDDPESALLMWSWEDRYWHD